MISDKKIGVLSDTNSSLIDHYEPEIVSAQDYYPFGMLSRSFIADVNSYYRFGFNGKEMDHEPKGPFNQLDYGMRIYDPRVGRFLSVDPITAKYPELTPYQFASNRPIDGIDQDGLEYIKPKNGINGQGSTDQAVPGRDPGTNLPKEPKKHDPYAWLFSRKEPQVPSVTISQGSGYLGYQAKAAEQTNTDLSIINNLNKRAQGDPFSFGAAYTMLSSAKLFVKQVDDHINGIIEGVIYEHLRK